MNYLYLPLLLTLSTTCSAATIEPRSVDCEQNSEYRTLNACEPVVMVIRHAEDEMKDNEHVLTDAGKNHAELYIKLFNDYIFSNSRALGTGGLEVCVCPIGKIIAIDKDSNIINDSPSSNPYRTIEPLSKYLNRPIQVQTPDGMPYSSGFQWNTNDIRLTLLSNNSEKATSTVIAWDKQGLNATKDDYAKLQIFIPSLKQIPYDQFTPLLKGLPIKAIADNMTFIPSRDGFYVFAKQDAVTGKFSAFKLYNQQFSRDGNVWYSAPDGFLNDLPSYIRLK